MKLHQEALVADMHCDTALRMQRGFDFSRRDTTGHMDIPRLIEGGIDLQVFACYISTETPVEQCRPRTDEIIDSLEAQIARNAERIAICRTASEAERIVESGRIAAFVGIENGVAIASKLDNLEHFYDRGVRYVTLTHTSSSEWCISSADTAPAFDGLTDFGREVVRKMNEFGMIVDISHASVSAVEEVLKVTADPIIASHSCVHSICPSDRNLTDEQISSEWNRLSDSLFKAHKTVIDSIRALYQEDHDKRHQAMRPIFEMMDRELDKIDVSVTTIVDHIDHIVNLVGPDYVGLGSDFDGVFSLPRGVSDCSMVPNITKELVRRGYSDQDIEKVLGGNFMRVFRQVCDR